MSTMVDIKVRIHVTDGQGRALTAVLDHSPDERVHVSGFTATFNLPDPLAWLEARMAEHPRGAFPRASLYGVTRKLASAIRSQVQPDPGSANGPEAES